MEKGNNGKRNSRQKIILSLLTAAAFVLTACAGDRNLDNKDSGGVSSAAGQASGALAASGSGSASGGSGINSGAGGSEAASGGNGGEQVSGAGVGQTQNGNGGGQTSGAGTGGQAPDKTGPSGAGTPLTAAVLGRDNWDINAFGRGIQLIGDTVYYVNNENEAGAGQDQTLFYRRKADGPEELVYTYTEPEGTEAVLYDACVDTEGNWYTLWNETGPEGGTFILEKRDSAGETVYREESGGFAGDLAAESLLECAADGEGCFYAVTFQGTLFMWDSQGGEGRRTVVWQDEEGSASYRGERGLLNGGTAGVCAYWQDQSSVFFRRVSAAEGVGQTVALELPLSGQGIFSGQAEGKNMISGAAVRVFGDYENGCWLADGQGLWHVGMEDGKTPSPVYLFGWKDSYVNLPPDQVELVSSPEEGRYLLLRAQGAADGAELLLAGLVTEEELPGKQVITLGCRNSQIALDNMGRIVEEYNNWSDKYVLELKIYGQNDGHAITGDFSALTADLLKGEGPDLFHAGLIPVEDYAAQGILEDLGPYLDAGQSGALVRQVRTALEIDGSLYTLSDSFTMGALAVRAGYSRDGGFSVAQLARLAEDFPEIPLWQYGSKQAYLGRMLETDWESYVDWEAKKSTFDSREFVSLLENADSWKEYDSANAGGSFGIAGIAEGEYLCDVVQIYSMSRYLSLKEECGEEAEITGYPNQAGEARYLLTLSNLFAINSASPNKEGAWDFMQYLLSDKAQENLLKKCDDYAGYGPFPITEEYFARSLQLGGWTSAGLGQPYEKRTTPAPEDEAAVRAMLDGLYYGREWHKKIKKFVDEEEGALFSGSRSAADVAGIIQNRVQLYLEEQ